MKWMKFGFWALALSVFTFQSCGSNTKEETTTTDSTMLVPEADNTGEGISDAGVNDNTGAENANTDNQVNSNSGDSAGMNENGGTNSPNQ
jgi:hypothetical protein